MAEIVAREVAEGLFEVEVGDGGRRYDYWVSVSRELADRVGAQAGEVVRATFAFLLEREPPTSIMRRFDCSVVSTYFPEYEAELPNYLREAG